MKKIIKRMRKSYMDMPLTGAAVLVCLWMAEVDQADVDIPEPLLIRLVELIEESCDCGD